MLNQPFIRALSTLLDNTTLLIGVHDIHFEIGNELALIGFEFQNTLLLIAESIQSNQKVLLHMHDAIINYLLPVLLSKVSIDPTAQNFSSVEL